MRISTIKNIKIGEFETLSSHKGKSISEFVENFPDLHGGVPNWNFHFIQNLNERELPQVVQLLKRLDGVRLNIAVDDRRFGKLSEVFSCKSAFFTLIACDVSPQAAAVSSLWKVQVLVKVKLFARLMMLGKINSKYILQKRRHFQSLSPIWCIYARK